jgi:hypothetical protein
VKQVCDRCPSVAELAVVRVRTTTGRQSLGLCTDCVAFYHTRHQIVGANLPPIGVQTAPLLGPKPGAQPTPMPRLPTGPELSGKGR